MNEIRLVSNLILYLAGITFFVIAMFHFQNDLLFYKHLAICLAFYYLAETIYPRNFSGKRLVPEETKIGN